MTPAVVGRWFVAALTIACVGCGQDGISNLTQPATTLAASVQTSGTQQSARATGGKGILARFKRVSSEPFFTEPTVDPVKRSGVYLTVGSMKNRDFLVKTMDAIKTAGGDALIFDIKGSFVYFDAEPAYAKELDLIRPAFDLQEVVSLAKEKGLYTIGRYIALKDNVFSAKVPAAQIKHPTTGRSVGDLWVDGSAEETLRYNREIITEILKTELDEINFDYIRFPTEYPAALRGYNGQQKADKIEPFLKMARETVDAIRPQTKLGISAYAILGWNYPVNLEALGQDFVRFAPLLDVISPMAYPSSFAAGAYYRPGIDPRSRMYYLVYRTMKGYADLLGPEHAHKLRPWIQGYFVTAKDMTDEIDAVYDAGACGFTVWNARNDYTPSYAAMKLRREKPERCKD